MALVGRDPDRLARAAARSGVPRTCRSLEEALGLPDLQAVSITTPPFLHAEQVIAAAEAGKHVLCEKPMANSVGECRQIIEACRARGVRLMMAYRKYRSEERRVGKECRL